MFDEAVIHFLNQFAHRSVVFDTLMVHTMNSALLKGGMAMALLWWVWFCSKDERAARNREIVVATISGAFVALMLAKVVEHLLPLQLRPINDPRLFFQIPYGAAPDEKVHWFQSSFPSDHAVLFFTLMTGMMFFSRKVGAFGFLYVLVVVCLPRVYLGVHYPTDILAGAVIGMLFGTAVNQRAVRRPIARHALAWAGKSPGTFYACFFLITYQVATLFYDLRNFGGVTIGLLKHVGSTLVQGH